MKNQLHYIYSQFQVSAAYVAAQPFGSGHINDTYVVETSGEKIKKYLLQRINHYVFRNPPEIMHNLKLIKDYLTENIQSFKISDQELSCFTFFPTKEKKYFFLDPQGNYWRLGIFIENSKSFDKIDSAQKAFLGGKAFGRFLALLSDFPTSSLYFTIKDFHNIDFRFQNFFKTLEADPSNRVKEVKKEINEIVDRSDDMKIVHQLGIEQKIPLRVTHNDTKFNNILFDLQDNIIGIIDLDTVMPGYVFSDFGDAIRTCTNTGLEDDQNLDNVTMNLKLFEAYSEGYLKETRHFLTPIEIEYLAFSAKLFTYMQALRFLTDYLDGDIYYKISYPKHNLQRVRAQLKLLQDMEHNFSKMKKIIKQLA